MQSAHLICSKLYHYHHLGNIWKMQALSPQEDSAASWNHFLCLYGQWHRKRTWSLLGTHFTTELYPQLESVFKQCGSSFQSSAGDLCKVNSQILLLPKYPSSNQCHWPLETLSILKKHLCMTKSSSFSFCILLSCWNWQHCFNVLNVCILNLPNSES